MKKYLLPNTGNFYKANLHVHTNVSDGQMTPEDIKRIYMEKGYSIVAYTDHEVMAPHPELTDNEFLALTATEISVNDRYDCDFAFAKTYHLNIYSPYENKSSFRSFDKSQIWLEKSLQYVTVEQSGCNYRRTYGTECVNEMIRMANEEGCLVSYNHPVWSQQNYSDYIGLKGLWGVELYNTACARNGYVDSPKPLDDLLRVGERPFPLASDDAHLLNDCFGGFLMVRAGDLSYDSIFGALKRGDFYASSGPEFHEISIEDGKVKILTSPASFAYVSTDMRHVYAKNAEEGLTTEFIFDINWYMDLSRQMHDRPQYIRITLVDGAGNTAYSRAYFIDELT